MGRYIPTGVEQPTPSDVEALRDLLTEAHIKHGRVYVGLGLARAVLASDWLAAREAAAEKRGAVKALREYADELTWTRPGRSPCENPESCCGSESSCDAMQPSVYVVGATGLRERADRIEGGAL